MPEFSCAAAGADSCGWKTSADSEDRLLEEVAEHLQHKHKVAHVSNTLKKYAAAVARGSETPSAPDGGQ